MARIARTGTIVGYDAESGEKLFTHVNREVERNGISTLPYAGGFHDSYDKRYRVVRVRAGSTEELYEIDVKEEKREE